MKRRIIKQGHNTLTITLPTKWAQNFNLQAGDEIELLEKENGLFLTTERKDNGKKSCTIDITGLDIPLIWKYFMVVYREGYDEVEVVFNPEEKYETPYKFYTSHVVDENYEKKSRLTPTEAIQQFANRFIGFEVIEHHKDYCIIKDMVEPTTKEFENSLRRVFLLIQQMCEEMNEAIQNDNPEIVAHTHDIDINVDKFHDYCVRVLNKTGFKDLKKTHILFSTLFILEIVGDEFKNVARHFLKDFRGKSLKNLKELGQMITHHFELYYQLFYKFDKEKVIHMSKQDQAIYYYLPRGYQKKNKQSTLTDDELEIFNHFRRISRYINALYELRIEMEF